MYYCDLVRKSLNISLHLYLSMDDEERRNEPKKTVFNSGIAALERLDALLVECHDYARRSQHSSNRLTYLGLWKSTLLRIYQELEPKLISNEKVVIKKLFKVYKLIGPPFKVINTEFDGPMVQINPSKFNKHWGLTMKIESTLRFSADARGMLVPDRNFTGGLAALRKKYGIKPE